MKMVGFRALQLAAVLSAAAANQAATATAPSPAPVCRAQKRSIADLTAICPATVFERSAANPPWTHEPFCIQSDNKWGDHFCVYTNADFRSGRGISIITDPESQEKLIEGSAAGQRRYQVASPPAKEVQYEAREQPGRGIGLFLKDGEAVKAGRTIMVDYPVVMINREALGWVKPKDMEELQWLAVLQLPRYARRKVRGLARSQGPEVDEVADLLKTNSIGQSFGEARHLSVFPEVARINHDCRPNAFYRFNETTMALEVFALRDMSGGEEITIAYLDTHLDSKRDERRAHLKEHWGFDCACAVCSLTGDDLVLSEDRRDLMASAKARLRARMDEPKYVYRAATQLVQLYDDEGLVAPRATANEIAAYASAMIGDENETRRFANAAKRYWRIMAGKDSGEVQRMDELRRDPLAHPSWNAVMNVGKGPEGVQKKTEEEVYVKFDKDT